METMVKFKDCIVEVCNPKLRKSNGWFLFSMLSMKQGLGMLVILQKFFFTGDGDPWVPNQGIQS
jgi:hypothetical protein